MPVLAGLPGSEISVGTQVVSSLCLLPFKTAFADFRTIWGVGGSIGI
jgi:hypothetical protein